MGQQGKILGKLVRMRPPVMINTCLNHHRHPTLPFRIADIHNGNRDAAESELLCTVLQQRGGMMNRRRFRGFWMKQLSRAHCTADAT